MQPTASFDEQSPPVFSSDVQCRFFSVSGRSICKDCSAFWDRYGVEDMLAEIVVTVDSVGIVAAGGTYTGGSSIGEYYDGQNEASGCKIFFNTYNTSYNLPVGWKQIEIKARFTSKHDGVWTTIESSQVVFKNPCTPQEQTHGEG